jgi:hypothetical protein
MSITPIMPISTTATAEELGMVSSGTVGARDEFGDVSLVCAWVLYVSARWVLDLISMELRD